MECSVHPGKIQFINFTILIGFKITKLRKTLVMETISLCLTVTALLFYVFINRTSKRIPCWKYLKDM